MKKFFSPFSLSWLGLVGVVACGDGSDAGRLVEEEPRSEETDQEEESGAPGSGGRSSTPPEEEKEGSGGRKYTYSSGGTSSPAEPTEGSGGSSTGSGGSEPVVEVEPWENDFSLAEECLRGESGFAELGAPCSASGGSFCDGQGYCTWGFAVVRLGTGLGALPSNRSVETFVDAYTLTGKPISSTVFPSTLATGVRPPLVLSSHQREEGSLSRSADAQSLFLAGYATKPRVSLPASVSSSSLSRVIGRVDSSGVADTSTTLGGSFSQRKVRGATSADGVALWVSGDADASAGLRQTSWGSTQAANGVLSTLTTALEWVNGRLYFSTNATVTKSFVQSLSLTTDLYGNRTGETLPGLPLKAGEEAYEFVLLDRVVEVEGPDTLYVSLPSSKKIEKYVFDGVTWNLGFSFAIPGPADRQSVTPRGLTAHEFGKNVFMIVSGSDGGLARDTLFVLEDRGSGEPRVRSFWSTPVNTALRGLALLPEGWSRFGSFDQAEPDPDYSNDAGCGKTYTVGQIGNELLLVCLDKIGVQLNWGPVGRSVSTPSTSDGRLNSSGMLSVNSPAALFCQELDGAEAGREGWYVPARGELQLLGYAWALEQGLLRVSEGAFWSSNQYGSGSSSSSDKDKDKDGADGAWSYRYKKSDSRFEWKDRDKDEARSKYIDTLCFKRIPVTPTGT